MDISMMSVVGKLFDKGWLQSRTFWVSLAFDVVWVLLGAVVLALQMIPLEQAAAIATALGVFQGQMMKYMRMITKTGILPVSRFDKEAVQKSEKDAEKAIVAAVNGEKPEPTIIARPPETEMIVKDTRPVEVQRSEVTVKDYFGRYANHAEVTKPVAFAAEDLIAKVNQLLTQFRKSTGLTTPLNPATGSLISGQTEGGFRLSNQPQGAAKSAHKEGKGVDIFDPDGEIDSWVSDLILETIGLYREAPEATRGWIHLATRAPGSGKRTFTP